MPQQMPRTIETTKVTFMVTAVKNPLIEAIIITMMIIWDHSQGLEPAFKKRLRAVSSAIVEDRRTRAK
jgi:hypothetical protein